MQQPENLPTLTSGVPNPPKASPRRVLSKVQRCALLVFTLAWVEAGCSGVQTRPDPEDCPKEAVDAMWEVLNWSSTPLHENQPTFVVDVTKGGMPEPLTADWDPLTVFKDGPVTGELVRAERKAPKGTRLEGHLWTTGDRIYGRYHRAHLPGGRTVPICLELGNDRGVAGIEKEEGSKPGAAVGSNVVAGLPVRRWR